MLPAMTSLLCVSSRSFILPVFVYFLHNLRFMHLETGSSRLNFDEPSLAAEFNLDPAFMKSEMIKTAKKVTEITDDEISMMCDELEKMFPIEISVYYEECIREMRKKVSSIK